MVKKLSNPWLFCTLLSATMLFTTPLSYADTENKTENTELQAEQQAAKIKSEKKARQNKKICKRVKVTGSQIRKSICNTQAGWRELENRSQESIRGMNRGPSVGGSNSN